MIKRECEKRVLRVEFCVLSEKDRERIVSFCAKGRRG